MDEASDDRVLCELVTLAREDAGRSLLQFGGLVSARQYRPLYRAMREYVKPGAHVLDWGTGNGHFSYYLLRAGYRATGFTVSPAAFEAWLPEGDWRFVQGSSDEPTALPFPAAAFDAVSSVGVLEHTHESGGSDRASLAELFRVLRPGGIFVCCHLPNRWSWIEWPARHVASMHHHTRRYGRSEVRDLFAASGFEVLEITRYGFLPRNLWARAPRWLADSRLAVALWDGLDALLGRLLPIFCQNFLIVARRPAS